MENSEIVLFDTSSKIVDFTRKEAVKNKGKKTEDKKQNPLSIETQKLLILEIVNRCYSVKIDGQKEILFDLQNGNIQHIERNYKNFSTVMFMAFSDLSALGYETIDLQKLFEIIKTRTVYSYRESRSIFHKGNRLVIDTEKNELISELKIDYDFQQRGISPAVYSNIVDGISKHWNDLIPLIIDHIVAGRYVSDKKNIWLLIMAQSNFGKSKLFKWLEPFGGSAFINFDDLSKSGISDKSPEEFEGKMCLVIDEVRHFKRDLFEIEDYLTVRPMRNHSVKIPINSRILLSADGGTFNNEYMDKQIINRVAVIDLREKKTSDLGDLDISKEYGHYLIATVMRHYLYTQIIQRIDEYERLTNINRANKADKTIKDIFKRFKQDKKDFFQIVEHSLYEILEDVSNTLDTRTYQQVEEAITKVDNRNHKGWIILRPQDALNKMLINYDKSLEYEIAYKSISQIANSIDGFVLGAFTVDGKTKRGLYIPAPVRKIETIYETIDKDGNLVDENGKVLF
ncbi:MAG: hypothetical protein GQ570_15560 [Helicobacteraceae bacterium]|nr:hypothetical protein [Helicobacteraceae bacterium]